MATNELPDTVKDTADILKKSPEVPLKDDDFMTDMLNTGLVKASDKFKPTSTSKSKHVSEVDRKNILEMLQDLAKYKDLEEDAGLSYAKRNKKEQKLPKQVEADSKGNLFDYVHSEMACLNLGSEKQLEETESQNNQVKIQKPKTSLKIASVSKEKQQEFTTEMQHSFTEVLEKPYLADATNQLVEVSIPFHGVKPKQGKGVKSTSKKNGAAVSQEIGSYTQLKMSMGSYTQLHNTMVSRPAHELHVDSPSPRKKNEKQKDKLVLQSGDMLREDAKMTNPDQPPTENKRKKKKKKKNKQLNQKMDDTQILNLSRNVEGGVSHLSQVDVSNRQVKAGLSSTPINMNLQRNQRETNQDIDDQLQFQLYNNDMEVLETIVKVPKGDHMYIMGPQMKHLEDIYNLTGVTVFIPPLNSRSEEVILKGDKLQLGPALSLMFSKSQQTKLEAMQCQGVRPKSAPVIASAPVNLPYGGHNQTFQGQSPVYNNQLGQYQGQMSRGQNLQYRGQGMVSHGQNASCQGQNLKSQQPASNQGQDQKGKKGHKQPKWKNKQGIYHTQWQHENVGPNTNQNDYRANVENSPNRIDFRSNTLQQNRHPVKGQVQYNEQQFSRVQGSAKGGQGRSQGQCERMKTPDRGSSGSQNQDSLSKSQGKRQWKKRAVFTEYLSSEEVAQGLSKGILIQGPIRVNPKNYEEAYVPHPDNKSDVIICGTKHRNRAFNGDIVAIQLMEEGDWQMSTNDLQLLEMSILADDNLISQDSDPEIVIESEEVIEIMDVQQDQKIRSIQTSSNLSPKVENTAKGGSQTAMKRIISLNDFLTGESPAKKCMGTPEGLVSVKKLLQRTGKVVAILEKKHSRMCTGNIKPMADKNLQMALFSPHDARIPRIMIPLGDCPPNFLERPEDFARTLYVSKITDWRIDSIYAHGQLIKSLGEAGEIEPETEGILIENGIDFEEFPEETLDCLPKELPWSIPEAEIASRRDYRSSCVFTIDPTTARDLDDALSCEELGAGRYKVGVHIADVSYFVKEHTSLDNMAAKRSTSVYLVHKVIPMLPRLLCEQLCSLNPNEDRLTFSVEWIISENGEIEEEWFGRSMIRSCVKLTYDHAQGFIEQPEKQWFQDELPSITNNVTVEDVKTRVLNLNKIAVNLRKARMAAGALRLDQVKLQYSLDSETGLPNGYWVYQQRDSNKLVEEFMLLANMAVAHTIYKNFPEKALLRRHPPPQEKMVENLKDVCSTLGINLDTSSAGAMQRSMDIYSGNDGYSLARMQVLVALCAKPMQLAKYFCTGCIDDESLYRHYALNVPLYTHFTSPIRRFPDIMVHRLLASSLGYCEVTSLSPKVLQRLADHCNDKKTAAKRVSDLSSELFFAIFVKIAGPLEEKAMVMGVLDKAFDIFVLKLGVTKRVYCDKLPIKEKVFTMNKKVPILKLTWKAEGNEPEIQQDLTIFSVVDCVLQEGDLPLQWNAIIKRPSAPAFFPCISEVSSIGSHIPEDSLTGPHILEDSAIGEAEELLFK